MTVKEFAALPVMTPFLDKCRWTFTAVVDDLKKPGKKKKIPVDLPHFLRLDDKRYWRGAVEQNNPFLTLRDIAEDEILGNVLTNLCLRLSQANGDDIVILDIEPDCPDNEKADFLALPWIYAETSVSGRGLHLVFPAPASHPEIRMGKTKLKPDNRNDYEILLNHYITFTMRPVAHDSNRPIRPVSDFEVLWESLIKTAKLREQRKFDSSLLPDLEEIPNSHRILRAMEDASYRKTPRDFGGDASRFEFGFCSAFYYRLESILDLKLFADHEYTDQEKLALLYEAVKNRIPYRPKHDEIRNGLSMLCSTCKNAMTKTTVSPRKDKTI